MDLSQLELVYHDSVSSLYFDPETPATYTVWHGFATSADFRATCLRVLDLMRDKRTYKGISDARQMRVISLADQKWFSEDFMEMVMALGVGSTFYSGVVVPHDYFGRQSIDNLVEQVDEFAEEHAGLKTHTRYFDRDDEAREWLCSVG